MSTWRKKRKSHCFWLPPFMAIWLGKFWQWQPPSFTKSIIKTSCSSHRTVGNDSAPQQARWHNYYRDLYRDFCSKLKALGSTLNFWTFPFKCFWFIKLLKPLKSDLSTQDIYIFILSSTGIKPGLGLLG